MQTIVHKWDIFIPDIQVVHQGFRQTGGSQDGFTSTPFWTGETHKNKTLRQGNRDPEQPC